MVANPRPAPLLRMAYKELLIWQNAMNLCTDIYAKTSSFPKAETYGLTAQLRRSAVSIASNIAEGEGRLTRGERRQALSNARGSLFEVETQLELAKRFDYGDSRKILDAIDELKRMLDAYIAYVRKKPSS